MPVLFFLLSGCAGNECQTIRVINQNALIQCPEECALADDMLYAVNRARSRIHQCGCKFFSPAGPVVWDSKLSQAASVHARDMAEKNFFEHLGSDGSDVGRRTKAAGFRWCIISENISAGFENPLMVVDDWLQSPSHCASLMDPMITTIGAACARNPESTYGTYWVLVMGVPKPDRKRRTGDIILQ